MRPYTDTREASAELLRIILPLMSKHAAGFHPVSYALWYEYATGANLALRTAVDHVTSANQTLDDAQVWSLYEKYILKRDDALSARMRAELERLLRELSGVASNTGKQASAYGESLDGFGAKLVAGIDPDQLKLALENMLEQTGRMCVHTSTLERQLDESTRRVEILNEELLRARDEALIDPLTGIANRRGFTKAVDDARAMRDGRFDDSCLIALDIDHFKKCNDTYGHLFGDKVIRNIATVLKNLIKGQDTAARIGGEEFLVFLPGTPLAGAHKLAEHIRATVATGRISSPTSGEVGAITISLGVTRYAAGETIESYVARADQALYASKSAGRNRVTVISAAVPGASANLATEANSTVLH